MDSALWLLLRLRLKAFLRRMGRSLRTGKGIALTLVGLVVIVPWMLSVFYAPRVGPMAADPAAIRRFGPPFLLAYAIVSLLFSTGERALYFTPAEVAFLFPGPFSRRALLAFKVVGLAWGCLFSSLFMVLAFGRAGRAFLGSFVAMSLALLFFQLLAMVIGLGSDTVAVLANSLRRRLVLGGVVVLATAALVSAGTGIVSLPPAEILGRIEASPVVRAATVPFRPFVLAFAAERAWPDLVGWGAVCLGMNLALLAAVFAIDAQYLEAAASSSAKIYGRLRKLRQGGGVAPAGSTFRATRFRVKMFPWLGGVGPVLWRQVSSAIREPIRLGMAVATALIPAGIFLFGSRNHPERAGALLLASQGMTLWVSIFLSPLVAFDFRGDVDRMEEIKTWPIRPAALVIGQILTPVLILTVPQWLVIAIASAWIGGIGPESLGGAAMALPAAFLMFGIENLLFLLFPTRTAAVNPADFTAFGRQMLLMFGKVLGVALAIGLSASVGLLGYFGLGMARPWAVAASVATAFGFAAGLVPLLVLAFQRYDVAADTPA